ncbi:MAG: hypothetical protein N2258_07150 [Brevinematales bacterium]|nr:hypothetical protein [Brevinematales bacterium]
MFKKIFFIILAFSFSSIYANDDELLNAYRVLKRIGEYENKKKAIVVFQKFPDRKRVISMVVDLLTYNYDNPGFKENDQIAFYDDVIAEELVKILDKERLPSNFPAFLRIVLYSDRHRDQTVKAAWQGIKNIDWTKE